ncbi:MAG: ABC transporter permease, partial [Planctomycetes bacterium]|nr:ABC transporter permease [Planctomycetota bacterium]
MIGIVFGVGSVIAMIAVGAGAEQALLREIGRLGIENIILNSVKPPEKRQDTQTNQWAFNRYGLTYKDERQIRETIPGLREVLPVHKSLQTAWWGSRRVEVTLNAVEARHLDLFRLQPD